MLAQAATTTSVITPIAFMCKPQTEVSSVYKNSINQYKNKALNVLTKDAEICDNYEL
jgi:hypothetical protein